MELMCIFTKLPADALFFCDLSCVLLLSSLFTAFDVKQNLLTGLTPRFWLALIWICIAIRPDCLLRFSTTLGRISWSKQQPLHRDYRTQTAV